LKTATLILVSVAAVSILVARAVKKKEASDK